MNFLDQNQGLVDWMDPDQVAGIFDYAINTWESQPVEPMSIVSQEQQIDSSIIPGQQQQIETNLIRDVGEILGSCWQNPSGFLESITSETADNDENSSFAGEVIDGLISGEEPTSYTNLSTRSGPSSTQFNTDHQHNTDTKQWPKSI